MSKLENRLYRRRRKRQKQGQDIYKRRLRSDDYNRIKAIVISRIMARRNWRDDFWRERYWGDRRKAINNYRYKYDPKYKLRILTSYYKNRTLKKAPEYLKWSKNIKEHKAKINALTQIFLVDSPNGSSYLEGVDINTFISLTPFTKKWWDVRFEGKILPKPVLYGLQEKGERKVHFYTDKEAKTILTTLSKYLATINDSKNPKESLKRFGHNTWKGVYDHRKELKAWMTQSYLNQNVVENQKTPMQSLQ